MGNKKKNPQRFTPAENISYTVNRNQMVHCEIGPLKNHTYAEKASTIIVWLRTEVSLHDVVRNWRGRWGGGGGPTKDIVLGEGSYKEQSRLNILSSVSFSCNLA